MKNMKIALPIILIILIVPTAFLVANKVENQLALPPTNSGENYWNLITNDELVWLLNNTEYYKGDVLTQSNAFIQAKIIDNRDSSLDLDNLADLSYLLKAFFGTEFLEIGLTTPAILDNALSLIMTLMNVIPRINQDAVPMNVSLSIPSETGISHLYSGLFGRLMDIINYSDIADKFQHRNSFWNYELEDFNITKNADSYGLFTAWNYTSENQITIEKLFEERNFSRGFRFNVKDISQIDMNNNGSYLSYANHMINEAEFLSAEDYDLSKKYAKYSYKLFREPNATIIFDFGDDRTYFNYSMQDRIDSDISQHFLLNDTGLYYYQKPLYTHWTGTWTQSIDTEGWKFLTDKVPMNEWFNIEFHLDKTRGLKDANEQRYRIDIYHENYYTEGSWVGAYEWVEGLIHFRDAWDQALRFDYNGIALINASLPTSLYLDDSGDSWEWGRIGNDDHEDAPAEVFEFTLARDDLTNPLKMIQLISPMTLFIFPNENAFSFPSFLQFGKDQLEDAELPEDLRPKFLNAIIVNEHEFGISINQSVLEEIFSTLLKAPLNISSIFGLDSEFQLSYLVDRDLGLLKELKYEVKYNDIDAHQVLSCRLIKTKNAIQSQNGYYYFDRLNNGSNVLNYREQAFESRLYKDSIPDRIDPTQYSLDFAMLIESVIGGIDKTALFGMIIQQNPTPWIVMGSGLGTFSVLANVFVILKWKKVDDD